MAGHCELESVRAAVAREAQEEGGLNIDPRELSLVHTVHLLDPGSTQPLIELFFAPARWPGMPTVREPHRCTEWRMWPIEGLPEQLVDYTRVAITGIAEGRTYSEMGWQ